MYTTPLKTIKNSKVALVGKPQADLLKDIPNQGTVIAIGAPSGLCALSKQEQRDLLNAAIKQFDNLL